MKDTVQKIASNKFVILTAKAFFSVLLITFVINNTFKYDSGIYSKYEYYINSLLKVFFTIVFALAIWKFEKLYQTYKNSEKKQGLWYAVYFAVFFSLLFNPLEPSLTNVTKFSRIIGAGLIEDIDVSKLINNFNTWFMMFVLAFFLFLFTANYFFRNQKGEQKQKIINFLDNLIVIANVNILFRCITFFYNKLNNKMFCYLTYLIFLIVSVSLAYLVLNLDKYILADDFTKLIIIGFSLSFPVAIFFKKECNFEKLFFSVQAVIFIVFILIIKCSKAIFKNKLFLNIVTGSVIVSSVIPFATSFYIELINILNQHSVFVTHLRKYYFLSMAIGILITACFCFISHKKNWSLPNWKSWAYPCLIFGNSCLSVQIPLEGTYEAHIFETANSSVLISDFLNFGSIPLVEHYGGHMMTDVWESLIYAFLNKDSSGAIFSPYSVYILPVLSLLFFYLVKNISNEDSAFWGTLIFPFYSFWSYFGLGMLTCIAALVFVKKNSYSRAILFWTSFIWCTVYRLDLGFSFGFACIVALTIYAITFRKLKAVNQLLITLICCGLIGGITWFTLCTIKKIDAISRLTEFLLINLSNINWGYGNIGDAEKSSFSWAYIFIPFTVIACLVYMIFSKKFREQSGTKKWMILLIFGFSYLINFSRGIVRHSLAEMTLYIVVWSAYIFISIFISCLNNNTNLFFPTFSLLILINTLFLQSENFTESPILESAISQIATHTGTWGSSYWSDLNDRGQPVVRVKWSENLKNTIKPYDVVINGLLKENETFIDFINKSFVYSALNKRNPVYVSQSPLQLSGEFTQQQFIKSMKGIPLVLMPIKPELCESSLDGITNATRCYKVAEYIYQNYIPLCKYGDTFAVWCLQNRYDEILNKAIALFSNKTPQSEFFNCEIISYGYDGPKLIKDSEENKKAVYVGNLHNHSIGHLPIIWAEKDIKNAAKNSVVTSLSKSNNVYKFNNETFLRGKNGNYLLISANCNEGCYENINNAQSNSKKALVKLGTYENDIFNEKYQYSMDLQRGQHDYLIRVSNDYYWYFGDINAVKIQADVNLQGVEMHILEGD